MNVLDIGRADGFQVLVLKPLVEQEMNIEYLYCFVEKSGENAVVIIRVEEAEQAIGALKIAGYRVIPSDELYAM